MENQTVKKLENILAITPQETEQEIQSFLRGACQKLNRDGIVLGLSGGLDSATLAYLAVSSVGGENVRIEYLPERDSKAIHETHARLLADRLGLPIHQRDLTPSLAELGVYQTLPLEFVPGRRARRWIIQVAKEAFNSQNQLLTKRLSTTGNKWIRRGNAYINSKHRMRMLSLYLTGESLGYLVVGAANKTEWMTGTFTKWGCDHCADAMPLLHLYRSQILSLAEHFGMPQAILNKTSDPDVLPGLADKEQLLGSFYTADLILAGLEHEIDRELLRDLFSEKTVAFFENLVEESAHMRQSPYNLLSAL